MDTQPTDQPDLIVTRAGAVASLVLNRPKQRNALSKPLIGTLLSALTAIGNDPAVRLVVLSASGPSFCAGHDLKEIRANPGRDFIADLFDQCSALMMKVQSIPQPVIAKVHGVATAAGCQLVASCDLAIAASDARFATPGVNIGLFCSTPMVALSRAVPRKAAMDMLLTGEMIGAEKAQALGLINRIAEPEQLDKATDELVSTILSKSPVALKTGKEAFYRQVDLTTEEAYSYVSVVMTENMMHREAQDGIDAFLEKRPPPWKDD